MNRQDLSRITGAKIRKLFDWGERSFWMGDIWDRLPTGFEMDATVEEIDDGAYYWKVEPSNYPEMSGANGYILVNPRLVEIVQEWRTCICPCRCGCDEPHFEINDSGLCPDCEIGTDNHEVPPEGIEHGVEWLLAQHRSIVTCYEKVLRERESMCKDPWHEDHGEFGGSCKICGMKSTH